MAGGATRPASRAGPPHGRPGTGRRSVAQPPARVKRRRSACDAALRYHPIGAFGAPPIQSARETWLEDGAATGPHPSGGHGAPASSDRRNEGCPLPPPVGASARPCPPARRWRRASTASRISSRGSDAARCGTSRWSRSIWSRGRIVDLARAQAEANRLETVACFAPGDAVYVGFDGSQTWEGPTPTGLYVVERLRLAEPIPETEELAARRAWLHAFERAVSAQSARYIIGDGTNGGERARPADRVRLAGRGPDGLPAGLHRCFRCGRAAGDYLRGAEVIHIYCACDNHNRCARCRLPLAAHRLSAFFWDDEDGHPWHVAAYEGFSHRCPDEAGASRRQRSQGQARPSAGLDGPPRCLHRPIADMATGRSGQQDKRRDRAGAAAPGWPLASDRRLRPAAPRRCGADRRRGRGRSYPGPRRRG